MTSAEISRGFRDSESELAEKLAVIQGRIERQQAGERAPLTPAQAAARVQAEREGYIYRGIQHGIGPDKLVLDNIAGSTTFRDI